MRRRVGVAFGGYSAEHDVSIMSARSLLEAIDTSKFEVRLIGFDKAHRPHLLPNLDGADSAALFAAAPAISTAQLAAFLMQEVDVVFPLIHGPGGEDGKLQGFIETLGLPLVGAGVTASALCMDKRLANEVMRSAGLPVVDSIAVAAGAFRHNRQAVIAQIEAKLTYPLFTKPSNLGSSIGISKVKSRRDLPAALQAAFQYDHYVVVEQGIQPRELECAVYGNDSPQAMAVGEIIPSRETYDYEAKYSDAALSEMIIPAPIDAQTAAEIKRLSLAVYQLFDIKGMARVDFLMDKSDGKLYINELNTLPGFTKYSMFPRLCEADGLSYRQLVTTLIELAIERQRHERYYAND